MKHSRSQVRSKAHVLPELKFESQTLTSYAGLVVFQKFFAAIALKARIAGCFRHRRNGKVFDRATIFLQLVIHLLLGFRELRDGRHYRDDPLVKRLLGLKRLPDVATLSRMLREADAPSVERLRRLLREMVLKRLGDLAPARITLDFDGSVQSTRRHAEGTAVGFNKRRKGARSYYPLFCTIAQTGQVLDFLHRPGNVHDSNGAEAFIMACLDAVAQALPGVLIEARMDSAFFSDPIVAALAGRGVEFTITVPFERWLKSSITALTDDPARRFRITHPFHPRHGCEYELILRRQGWGEDRVDYLDDAGGVRMIPANWTSLAAADPFVAVSAGRSWFRPEDLLVLGRLLEAMGGKESER